MHAVVWDELDYFLLHQVLHVNITGLIYLKERERIADKA